MATDMGGLFAARPAPGSPADSSATRPLPATAERRQKLYGYDSAAAQALNPYGPSNFTTESTADVWKMVSKGSRKAAFHSELAAEDGWRIGVGLSRTAETLLEALKLLDEEHTVMVLKPEILQLAKAEAAELQPHLEVLNFGKGSEKESSAATLSSVKRRKVTTAVAPPDEATVGQATDKFRDWLCKSQSPLRTLFAIMAGSGTWWAAHVAEKVVRAAVLHKPLDAAALRAAALARRKEPAPSSASAPASSDDFRGLSSLETSG